MKKISILALALFLIFAFGFQVYAEEISAGTTGTNVNNRTDDDTRGLGTTDNRANLGTRGYNTTDTRNNNFGTTGTTYDRTNINDNRGDLGGNITGYNNNLRTNAATDNNNGWGWLGILGLLGLAGMFGRNRNPQR